MSDTDVDRYRTNLRGEIDGIALYRTLAETEESVQLKEIYSRLAQAEERHAEIWRSKLHDAGQIMDERAGWRTRFLIWVARRFGPSLILPTVIGREHADSDRYRGQSDAVESRMNSEERSHARIFTAIGGSGHGGLA